MSEFGLGTKLPRLSLALRFRRKPLEALLGRAVHLALPSQDTSLTRGYGAFDQTVNNDVRKSMLTYAGSGSEVIREESMNTYMEQFADRPGPAWSGVSVKSGITRKSMDLSERFAAGAPKRVAYICRGGGDPPTLGATSAGHRRHRPDRFSDNGHLGNDNR